MKSTMDLLRFFRNKKDDDVSAEESESGFLDLVLASQQPVADAEDDGSLPPETVYTTPLADAATEEKLARLTEITRLMETRMITPEPVTGKQSWKVNYAAALNAAQWAAVTETQAPLLVIAGAGSGKTRVITYKVSYLIENGILPHRILLLTFTRKASREMLVRVGALLNSDAGTKVSGGTFHSFSVQTLRKYGEHIGLKSNFTVLDTEDASDTIDLVKAGLDIEKKGRVFPRKGRLQEVISHSRNRQISIADVIEQEFPGLKDYSAEIEKIAAVYTRYKREANLLDFDDLLEVLRDALRDDTGFRDMIRRKFDYVMVDEYQDTNRIQKELVDLISDGKRLMVVGDDAQSIYSFRGADFENILRFPETYPDCKVVKIEQNYRSNQPILNLTNAVINQAVFGYKKHLFSEHASDVLPLVKRFYSAEEEAVWIAEHMQEQHTRGVPFSEMAVLVRALWHSNLVQAELLTRGIPYVVIGGIRFHEKRHVKDIIAHLRLAVNPFDAVAWMRILKLLPGIGQATAKSLITHLIAQRGDVRFDAFNKRAFYGALQKLESLFNEVRRERVSVTEAVNITVNYYQPILQALEDDADIRLQDLKTLAQLAAKYRSLDSFLGDFAIDPPSDRFQDAVQPLTDASEEKPAVISTVHSAKGLEWNTVFVPFALDGLFPSARSLGTLEELDEERRLFYVACSRARESLTITLPAWVQSWDKTFSYPSRFLAGLPEEVFRFESGGQNSDTTEED